MEQGRFIEAAVGQYLYTALATESCNGTAAGCNNGEDCDTPLWNEGYDRDSVAGDSREAAERDVRDFVERTWESVRDLDPTDIGGDLWMTRTGEGVGFWDGDYPWPYAGEDFNTIGDYLTAVVEKHFPHRDAYVGDDNKVHIQ